MNQLAVDGEKMILGRLLNYPEDVKSADEKAARRKVLEREASISLPRAATTSRHQGFVNFGQIPENIKIYKSVYIKEI